MPPPPPPALDHLVHLISPPSTLDDAIALYADLGFLVLRGGRHADGLTENALIVLPDGVYLELIAFVVADSGSNGESTSAPTPDFEARRRAHWWYGRTQGWIDWCLLGGHSDGRVDAINNAAAAAAAAAQDGDAYADDAASSPPAIRYSPPRQGGRTTLRGDTLAWHVSFPSEAPFDRGRAPFWCDDVTPRPLRVPPLSSPHPNGATGITSLCLLFREESLQGIISAYARVLDQPQPGPPSHSGRGAVPAAAAASRSGHGGASFVLRRPAASGAGIILLEVKAADDPAEREWIQNHGEGLYEVEIGVAPDQLPTSAPPDGIERQTQERGYGRLRLHPVLSG